MHATMHLRQAASSQRYQTSLSNRRKEAPTTATRILLLLMKRNTTVLQNSLRQQKLWTFQCQTTIMLKMIYHGKLAWERFTNVQQLEYRKHSLQSSRGTKRFHEARKSQRSKATYIRRRDASTEKVLMEERCRRERRHRQKQRYLNRSCSGPRRRQA